MTAVKGVLFDLGGVLCHVDEAPVWQAWHQHTGISGDDLRAELYERGLKHEFDCGLKHPAGVAMFLATRWEVGLTSADWRRIWGLAVAPDPAMDALAAEVAARVPCALASTTDRIHHEKLGGELGCFSAFRAQAVSYKIGFVKPHPTFYREALELLGTSAPDTLFIDDKPENVDGARRAGMQALHFTGIDALRAELARRGL
jgi:putative hydrolase of the HAD superfamily